MEKKALLVISFGTSYPETRKKTIEATENRLKEAFPDHDFYRAFTSRMIINKLKTRDNESVDTPQEVLKKLKAAGYSFDDVVKSTVLLSDMDNFAAMNEVYASIYKRDMPARAAYGVVRLPLGVLVEIETIAVK